MRPAIVRHLTRTANLLLVALVRRRARATPTAWALGIEALLRAILGGEEADASFRASIQHLGRAGVGLEVARSHLL